MEQKLILFLKKMWTESVVPSIQSFATKNKENADRIIKAFEEKEDIEEISINNPEDIVNPLVEAQNATTQAIKDLPRVEIPETDLKGLESKIEALQKTLENKKLEVNIGETKLELKPVIDAISKIKLEIPKMEKQEVIDYTMMLSQIMDIMERPQDYSHMIEMKNIMSKCARTEDIAILAEYLQKIIDKASPEQPEFEFTKEGRLKVAVDRVGGGGGIGLTKIETDALINLENKDFATEETLQSIVPATNLSAGGKISVGTTPVEATFAGTTKSIIITADKDNVGLLYIGKSNVTSAGANSLTFLEAGDSISMNYNDATNGLFVVSDTASQNFWKGCLI